MKVKQPEPFSIKSNSPHKEFIRFLLHNNTFYCARVCEKKTPSANDIFYYRKMAENVKKIDNINSNLFLYDILDLIYLGKKEMVQTLCGTETYSKCCLLLENPDALTKEIYVDFASQYLEEFNLYNE